MRIDFIQGILKTQANFAVFNNDNVDFSASNNPTLITFAHGLNNNYVFQDTNTVVGAWVGPFPVTTYLYWDLDTITGARTYGSTILAPITSATAPSSPADNQHWFDTGTRKMFVRSGARWIEKIRVFAGSVVGSVVTLEAVGTQVGLAVAGIAGFLLIDDVNKAVKSFDRSGAGKFITTETPLATQRTPSASVKLEAALVQATASESIPEFSPVNFTGTNTIGLAQTADTTAPAIGIVTGSLVATEKGTVISRGFVENLGWNWTAPAGSPVFVSAGGTLTTTVPNQFSLQEIARVVSPTQLFVDVQPQINLSGAANAVNVVLDKTTGTLAAIDPTGGSTTSSGATTFTLDVAGGINSRDTIVTTATTAITVNIPAAVDDDVNVGYEVTFIQGSTGAITFVAGLGTTLGIAAPGTATLTGQYAKGTLYKIASTVWVLCGDTY